LHCRYLFKMPTSAGSQLDTCRMPTVISVSRLERLRLSAHAPDGVADRLLARLRPVVASILHSIRTSSQEAPILRKRIGLLARSSSCPLRQPPLRDDHRVTATAAAVGGKVRIRSRPGRALGQPYRDSM